MTASTKARRLEAAWEELTKASRARAEADRRVYEARQRFDAIGFVHAKAVLYTAECAVDKVLDKIAAIEAEP